MQGFFLELRLRSRLHRYCVSSVVESFSREVNKLRRLLQRKRHIKIELRVRLSVLRLFHVGHVVRNGRSELSLSWHERLSCKAREWKIYSCGLALSSEPQTWTFHARHLVDYVKKLHQKACRPCSTIIFQPIISLICGVVTAVAGSEEK